jgi:hypothetical protein
LSLAESESIANETLQADALTSVSFTGSATDTQLAYSGASGSRLNYSWSILSSQCGMATISNSTSDTPVLSLLDVGSFVVRSHCFSFFPSLSFLLVSHSPPHTHSQLQLCASDGELSSGAQLQVLVTASEPYIITQPQGGTLKVPRGSLVSLDVAGNGVPAPTYQWHYLTYENRTVENTTNPGENTTVLERSYYDDDGEFPGEIEEDYEPPQHWFNNRATWEIVEVRGCPSLTRLLTRLTLTGQIGLVPDRRCQFVVVPGERVAGGHQQPDHQLPGEQHRRRGLVGPLHRQPRGRDSLGLSRRNPHFRRKVPQSCPLALQT